MFNTRNVREAVAAKLAIIGRVDEAIIHDLYARAIFDELKAAHQVTQNIKGAALACVKARSGVNTKSKWVLVDSVEWEALGKAIETLAGQFKQ